jgi:GNAT superfamily N-acetyltransferase
MNDVAIRTADASDIAFLEDMLVEAANAPDREDRGRAETLADPAIGHYIEGWPRATDIGVVAIGEREGRIGAAWLRFFDGTDPAYGFVRADIPELAIGVVADRRGHGIGRALLRAVADVARKRGGCGTLASAWTEPIQPPRSIAQRATRRSTDANKPTRC